MKLFKLAAVVSAAVFSLSLAQADENLHATRTHNQTSFTMDSYANPGETVLYTCTSLVDRTEGLLKEVGARDVRVQCMGNGGFNEPTLNPMVMADFTSVHLKKLGDHGPEVAAGWRTVVLHDYQDCDTARQLLVGVAAGLELRNLNPARCGLNNGAYRFAFDALVEK